MTPDRKRHHQATMCSVQNGMIVIVRALFRPAEPARVDNNPFFASLLVQHPDMISTRPTFEDWCE